MARTKSYADWGFVGFITANSHVQTKVSSPHAPPRYLLGKSQRPNPKKLCRQDVADIRAYALSNPELSDYQVAKTLAAGQYAGMTLQSLREIVANMSWVDALYDRSRAVGVVDREVRLMAPFVPSALLWVLLFLVLWVRGCELKGHL